MRERWSLVARLYPDIDAGQQNLGLVAWWHDNDLATAAIQFRSVLAAARNPQRSYTALFLGDVLLAQGDFAGAETAYRSARELGQVQRNLNPAHLPMAQGDYARARSVIDAEPTRNFPMFEAEKQLRLAALEVDHGDLGASLDRADRAAEIAREAKLEPTRARARLARVAILAESGATETGKALQDYVGEEAERAAQAAASHDYSSATHLVLAAQIALRAGRADIAAHALKAAEPLSMDSGFHSRRGPFETARCEALIAREAERAVACLNLLMDGHEYLQAHVALLRAARGTQPAIARREADWLLAHRGLAVAEMLAEYAPQVLNLLDVRHAELDAAELAEDAGDRAAAIAHLARFRAAWPALPEGAPARRHADALQRRLAQP